MVKFSEKREYFRMNVDCRMDYRFRGTEGIHQARCLTLSGSGISFIVTETLDIDAELEITLPSQLPLTPPMRGIAKVTRVQVLGDQTFEIGASMTVLHDDNFLPSN